jgi:uncharacterized protein (TIGR03546 family)
MLRVLLKPVRLVIKAFTSNDSPAQLAAGFALGMMIGLMPKGNLAAGVLSVLLLATRVNLGAAAAAAGAFSWLGMWTDPFAQFIGLSLLTAPSLRATWTSLYNLPLVPWTHFNNTLVLGNLLLAGCLFYPVYHLGKHACQRWRPWLAEKAKRHELVDLLARAENALSWRPRA